MLLLFVCYVSVDGMFKSDDGAEKYRNPKNCANYRKQKRVWCYPPLWSQRNTCLCI